MVSHGMCIHFMDHGAFRMSPVLLDSWQQWSISQATPLPLLTLLLRYEEEEEGPSESREVATILAAEANASARELAKEKWPSPGYKQDLAITGVMQCNNHFSSFLVLSLSL